MHIAILSRVPFKIRHSGINYKLTTNGSESLM